MKKVKPYKYRNPRIAIPDYAHGNTVLRVGDQEVLSGQVGGMKASDLEERFARSMGRLEVGFEFRVRLTTDALGDRELTRQFANLRGEVEMDFLPNDEPFPPIFIDGQISHYLTAWQAEQDKLKTDVVDEFFRRVGGRKPAVRIPFWKLLDQDMSDRTAREIFL